MKVLSIEQKAKAYDEAIERVKNIKTGKCETTFMFTKGLLEHIFPELAESEGEKTKRLLHTIANKISQHLRDIFTEEEFQCFDAWSNAWLEKQGEHAKFIDSIQVGDKVTRNEDGVLVNLSQLNRVAKKDEKQGEQKLAPKFKVGDKVHFINGTSPNYEDDCIVIGEISNDTYYGNWKGGYFSVKEQDDWELVEQKPVELSEKDKRMLEQTIELLDKYGGDRDAGYYTLAQSSCRESADWLKSLRPQSTWKPSDKQLVALRIAIGDEQGSDCCDILRSLLKDLKSL